MGKFFDSFPKTAYDIQGKQLTNFNGATNIFFRTRMIRDVLKNISAYYEHTIQDGDTPEILADKVYGEPEAYWIILYANDIIDPQYGWPLNYRNFKNYIIKKYGSVANARTQIHHYEKVIERTESLSDITTETRFYIDEEPFSNVYYTADKTVEILLSDINGAFFVGSSVNVGTEFAATVDVYEASNGYIRLSNSSGYFYKDQRLDSGYIFASTSNGVISSVISPGPTLESDFETPYDTFNYIPETGYFQTFNMGYQTSNTTNTLFDADRTVFQRTYRNSVSCYDWEEQENDRKRLIKIIKPEYYGQIMAEFNELTRFSSTPFIRRFT